MISGLVGKQTHDGSVLFCVVAAMKVPSFLPAGEAAGATVPLVGQPFMISVLLCVSFCSCALCERCSEDYCE